MSIQSNINQGINIAAALYTQTPEFKDRQETKKLDKAIKTQTEGIKEVQNLFDKDVSKSEENIAALRSAQEQYPKQAKELEKDIKKEQENIDVSKGTKAEFIKNAQNEGLDLLRKKAELTGDYRSYYVLKKGLAEKQVAEMNKRMEDANKRANGIKEIKKKQPKWMSEQTSLGAPLSELGFSKETLKKIRQQLPRGGK